MRPTLPPVTFPHPPTLCTLPLFHTLPGGKALASFLGAIHTTVAAAMSSPAYLENLLLSKDGIHWAPLFNLFYFCLQLTTAGCLKALWTQLEMSLGLQLWLTVVARV